MKKRRGKRRKKGRKGGIKEKKSIKGKNYDIICDLRGGGDIIKRYISPNLYGNIENFQLRYFGIQKQEILNNLFSFLNSRAGEPVGAACFWLHGASKKFAGSPALLNSELIFYFFAIF